MDWGHGARRQAMKPNSVDFLLLSKFKLYLDEHLQQEALPNNLNVIDVIADYMGAFHQHVCNELLKGFAGNYDQSKFRYVSILYPSFMMMIGEEKKSLWRVENVPSN